MKLSDEVERLVHEEQTGDYNTEDAFWHAATLAEVWLLRNDLKKARACYLEMRRIGVDRLADIGACARVCRMLIEGMGRDPHLLDGCFRLDPVIVFSGHFFDAPGQVSARFPIALEKSAQAALRALLRKYSAPIGYCSLSWGADMLFAEELLKLPRPTLHICLPADADTTRKNCVARLAQRHRGVPSRGWCARFDGILDKAASVKILPLTEGVPSPEDHAYLNTVMAGLAMLRARSLERAVLPLVLWNGSDEGDHGGIANFTRLWRDEPAGKPVIIDPRKLPTRSP